MNDFSQRIAKLSAEQRALLEAHLEKGSPSAALIPRLPRTGQIQSFPVSFAEQRLWFLEQWDPNSPLYNIAIAYALQGPVNTAVLERCAKEIVSRHESLRTSFSSENGQPVQVIHPSVHLSLALTDLSDLPEDRRETEARELAAQEAHAPFDLTKAPLLRIKLLRVTADKHVLLIVIHHIVSDGWSIGVFLKELSERYSAYSRGVPPSFPELPIQYADYAVWQRQWLQNKELDKQRTYWKKQLAGIPALLELPTDRPRPALQSFNGARQTRMMPKSLGDGLKTLSQREGATLFMALLAAFQILLSRYSRSSDIAVGSPIAGRTRAETESLMGFFVNTLVLRTGCSGDPTFLELVSRVREVALSAYAHQDIPFEKLVEESKPERSVSYSPLFQVMFALQNMDLDLGGLTLAGLEVTHLSSQRGTAKFDLIVFAFETAHGLEVVAEYNTDLFADATIARLLGHYENLLHGIVDDPQAKLSKLPLLSDVERKTLIVDWNDTGVDYAKKETVAALFEAQVKRTPQMTALVFEDESLSYAALNAKANRLAHRLIGLGVGPEVVVGVCVQRSIGMAVGVLAILKAGGAYLPLDPDYPHERLAFMLEDGHASVLIMQHGLEAKLPQRAARIYLESLDEKIDAYPEIDPPSRAAPENLAYVIYTSGSTGQPKGVAMTHGPLCNLVSWHGGSTLAKAARTLQFASLSFDVSFQEMFSTWCSGGTLVLTPEELRRDTAALLRFIQEKAITRLFLPFVVLQHMAELADEAPASLREIITAGEQLKITPQIADFLGKLDQCTLHNHYGPTESHVVTAFALVGSSHEWPPFPPIGRPIANARIYVLDGHLNPTPMGVPGELHIGGDVLARGYLNRPALTAEKFIPNPFSDDPDARLYRTGDLARYLADGNIEFLGRIDDQVKIRGFRIELGEIEAVLNERVKACAVVAREDQANDPSTSLRTNKRLVAYIVPDENLPVALGDLRDFLRQKLPDYMLPSVFIVLDKLPVTPNGKLDRKALPAPDDSRPELEAAYVAPRTPAEEALAAIWGEVLKLDRIGIHDNFFELGGHSLLATQVIARVRGEFQVEVPLRALFEAPTIEALNRKVMKNLNAGERKLAPISRRTSSGSAPLSFAQQRLWFLDQLEPASAAYNMAVALRMTGALNVAALTASLSEIVRRHEALRTTVATNEGEPAQVIHQPHEFDLAVADLSHLELGVRETEALRLASDEAQRPFVLASGPLFRARLFKLDDHQHLLVYTLHHIVSDGWSMSILSRELCALYRAYAEGRPSPLGEVPIQYADYAVWQRGGLAERELQQQLSYWKKQLEGAPVLSEFPTDFPRPPAQRYQGAHESLTLSRKLTGELKLLSRSEGVTLFMTLLAAFKILLYRHSGQEDLLIGTHSAGRNRQELEGVIGFFIGTLALRSDLSGNPPFRQLLHGVRETALGAYAHQDVPFEKLIEELQPERSLSHTPLVQVVFNMLNLPPVAFELPGLTIECLPALSAESKFDLTLYAREQNEGLAFKAVYDTELFAAATIKRLLGHFGTLLRGIVAVPDCRLSKLPLLSETETAARTSNIRPRQAFIEFSADAIEQSIVQRFEQQVGICPNRLAVKTRTHEWSYEELNHASNRVAQALLSSRGAGAEMIALLLEHGAPMIAAMLGVLKAGKSYMPLTVSHPPEALAYMVEDSDAQMIVTDTANLALADALAGNHLALLDSDCLPQCVEDIELAIAPETIAYILYTSGSTGKPKGVVQNHRNVLHFIRTYTNNLHISANDRLTLLASYGFDAAVMDIYGALLNGASLYALDLKEEGLADLAGWLSEHEITIYHSTPTVYRYFTSALTREAFPAMRLVVLGGEEVFRRDFELYKKHFPQDSIFVNGLGPTESTISLQYFVDHKTELTRDSVPVGYPVADTEVLLLDEAGEPTELFGEIAFKSPYVALGYWRKPELTAASFLSDPQGARVYRTGDMGRLLPDGGIEFTGRKDAQVKIRGYRVELRGIEAALAEHPEVHECAVILREDCPGDKRLVAYAVSRAGSRPHAEQLRDFAKRKLPEYMVPAVLIFLDALPLTPNGKVDRRALPAPDRGQPHAEGVFLGSRNAVERQLTHIWEQVLGVRPIGVRDGFFELGGHSLLAVRLFAHIEQTLGQTLPLATLFQAPTIEHQARLLAQGDGALPSWTSLVPIQPSGSRPPFFCVHAHQGYVFYFRHLAARLGPDQPFYGLQAQGLDGKHPIHRRVEDMAAHYLRELRMVQPTGPYFLGAHCWGGLVAFEMAQQLHAHGQQVALLALMDTHAPGCHRASPHATAVRSQALRLVQKIARHFDNLSYLRPQEKPVYLWDEAKLALTSLLNPGVRRFTYMSSIGSRRSSSSAQANGQEVNFSRLVYVPSVYPGRVTLLRASKLLAGTVHDPQLGWGPLAAGGVEVHEVPGYYRFLNEPRVRLLTERLSPCLIRAQTAWEG